MNPIEILIPNKNPIILFPDAIQSIVFQSKKEREAYKDIVIIGISGWSKPYSYEGDDARILYDKLKKNFCPIKLDLHS